MRYVTEAFEKLCNAEKKSALLDELAKVMFEDLKKQGAEIIKQEETTEDKTFTEIGVRGYVWNCIENMDESKFEDPDELYSDLEHRLTILAQEEYK